MPFLLLSISPSNSLSIELEGSTHSQSPGDRVWLMLLSGLSPFKGRNVRDRQEREGRQSSCSSRGQGHTQTRVACLNGSLKICVQTSFSQAFILSRFYLSLSPVCKGRRKSLSYAIRWMESQGSVGRRLKSVFLSFPFSSALVEQSAPHKGLTHLKKKKTRTTKRKRKCRTAFLRVAVCERVSQEKESILSFLRENEWLSPVCCKRKR